MYEAYVTEGANWNYAICFDTWDSTYDGDPYYKSDLGGGPWGSRIQWTIDIDGNYAMDLHW